MLNHTFSQEGQLFKMVHQDAHGLVKLAILIRLTNLLGYLLTYLTYIYLRPTYLFT